MSSYKNLLKILTLSFLSLQAVQASSSKALEIYIFEDDSESYKQAISAARQSNDKRMLGSVIYDYAEKGVGGAIVSFYNASNSQGRRDTIDTLKSFGTVTDFWWAYLAKQESDKRQPECLDLFKNISPQYFYQDLDTLYNHATALALFGNPEINLALATQKAFEWRDRTPGLKAQSAKLVFFKPHMENPTENIHYLEQLYVVILGKIQESNSKKAANDFFIGAKNPYDGLAILIFMNTDLRDWIDTNYLYEKTDRVTHIVEPNTPFKPKKLSGEINAKHKENVENVESVVDNALSIILQQDEFKNFYKTVLKVELSDLTEKNIRDWAWEIVFKQRARLIQYLGNNLALQEILHKTDNHTLLIHIQKSLKKLLGFDD